MSKEKKIQKYESKQLIDELAKMPPMVIATAYLHAINYTKYGEDVTKKWVTAVQQSAIIENAYIQGYHDALKRVDGVIAEKTLGQINKLWIPLSVDTPKDGDIVIFSTTNKTVEFGVFVKEHYKGDVDIFDGIIDSNGEIEKSKWIYDDDGNYYTNDEVVAWMPFPDEYKEE